MLTLNERMKIGALMRREIVPAIGCTEPVSVALCTARAVETLENFPDRIEVSLSTNVIKNAMGGRNSRNRHDRNRQNCFGYYDKKMTASLCLSETNCLVRIFERLKFGNFDDFE